MNIKTIVAEFASRLSAIVESQAIERARAAVLSAFGTGPRRGPGRPPKAVAALEAVPAAAKKARKKPPRQLCPVPGCKNTAAPIFGMVCSKHKDLPKAQIKKFREARRAKKDGAPAPKAAKRAVAKKAQTKTKTTASPRKATKARKAARPAKKTNNAAAATPVAAPPPPPAAVA